MEDEIKVSELPEASQISDDDILMIVQNGANKKITRKKAGLLDFEQTENETYIPKDEKQIDYTGINFGGSDLIETVSNNNGTAIKFFDGTLICMNTVKDTYAITASWSNWYETAGTSTAGKTTFAVPFISKPVLSAVQVWNSGGGVLRDINFDATGISRVNWTRPDSRTSELVYSYIAIGRWK